VSFGHDGSASLAGIAERYERELGNDLGNLLSRTTAMIAKYRDGRVPDKSASPEIAAAIADVHDNVPALIDAFDLTGAIDRIWALVRELNRYVTEKAPWTLAKDEANADALDQVLYDLAAGLRAAAIALWAFLPETSPKILAALGQYADDVEWGLIDGDTFGASGPIEPAAPLFPRIESVAGADAA
jgi:methionyl-tRNA synthetase